MTEYKLRIPFTILMVVALMAVPLVSSSSDEVHSDTLVSDGGIEYEVRFFSSNFTLLVQGENLASKTVNTSYVIEVDKHRNDAILVNVSRGGEFSHKIKIKDSLNILSTNHTIYFSTFGADTRFNFTKEIDYRNTTRFPKPKITNVTVANGTVDGEPSTVAYVTVSNPTNQLYPMKLLVHTEETQGGLYGASTSEYTNDTVKVELLEEPGSTVAGEVRLYVGEPSEREGGLDQVEFVGRAGEETEVYDRSYEPATGPWAEDSYAYENESVGDENGLLPDGASNSMVRGLLAVGVVMAAVVLVRRWR